MIFFPEEISVVLSNLTNSGLIIISSIFLVVQACSSLIWALLAHRRFSHQDLLIAGTLEWPICCFLTAFATDFFSLLIFQILTAIGSGLTVPLTYSLIAEVVEIDRFDSKSFVE
ncbi:MAG: MFS transporter [Candidatus Hodarchaeales archaeon]